MRGKLYVVATPIGNLEDITLRAIRILKESDVILAEDTRVASKLLGKYDIHGKRYISFHEHNEEKRIQEVEKYLEEGKVISLVSDAGTPLIQDPGYRLVKHLREMEFDVIPVPGPTAFVAALSVSGMPTDSFVFLGFLPHRKSRRKKLLDKMKELNMTFVLYESVHRIDALMEELCEYFPERSVFVAREMTKLHEEYISGLPCEIKNSLIRKGEFVIVVGKQNEG